MSRRHYDPELFYPLSGKPRRSKFATIDLESKDGATENKGFTRPFLAGFYDGTEYKPFVDTNDGELTTRYYREGGCVDRLMHCCLSGKRIGTTYYCHNGGGFDFLFLLPWMMRNLHRRNLTMQLIPVGGSRLLAIKVSVKGQKWGGWQFVDSLKLLPMSLDQAGRSLVKKHKLEVDGKKFDLDTPSDDPSWIPYNRQDCVLLYDVIEATHEMVEHQFGGEVGLTAPSTAMKVFRRAFLKEPIQRDTATHAFIREGYFGGRTEVLASEGRHLHDFDLNSSYPHAMTKAMPVGDARVWGPTEPPREWREHRIGFCRVTVLVPDDIELPPLPVRADGAHFPEHAGLDGKLLFPTGKLRGVWEWDELQNAVSEGCTILEWHESVWYEAGPLLAEYVEVLYRYRDKGHCYRCHGPIANDYFCEKCNEPGYDSGLDAWAKLLLNSLYGKTGQRPERTGYYLMGDPEMPEGAMPLVPEDPHCPVWVAQTEVDSPFIMPQIAARVTAIGRVTLYRAARRAQKSVVRECWKCHSKVTFKGELRGAGWVLGDRVGGTGSHGDELALVMGKTIGRQGSVCPCGGAVETRKGRVYYMDTDSLLTDASMVTGKALGELKDEVPRYSGFLHGRFYASKMYVLTVEPSWLRVAPEVRRAMLERDGGYLSGLGIHGRPKTVEAAASHPEHADWSTTRSKGLSKKNRTAANLEKLYAGALARLEWYADPQNQRADGSWKELPRELEEAGTVVDDRLEQFGTLANLVERDERGRAVLHMEPDGYEHVTAKPFHRGPLMVKVPRRLHLEGAKRKLLPDGRSVPYSIDMTAARPSWWVEREERRAKLRLERAKRSKTARVTKPRKKASG